MGITQAERDAAPWMDVAREELGTLESATGDNPRVLGYLGSCSGSRSVLARDATPWCSAFTNWVMQRVNLPRTGRLSARSWIAYGTNTGPKYGAIVVLWRGLPVPARIKSAPGHVGFLERWDSETFWLLGGNQGNRVSVMPYPRSRVLAIRFPTDESLHFRQIMRGDS